MQALVARAMLSPTEGSRAADEALALAERLRDPYLLGIAAHAQARIAAAARDAPSMCVRRPEEQAEKPAEEKKPERELKRLPKPTPRPFPLPGASMKPPPPEPSKG